MAVFFWSYFPLYVPIFFNSLKKRIKKGFSLQSGLKTDFKSKYFVILHFKYLCIMNITAEKQNILQWIQGSDDGNNIEKTLSFKEENDFLIFENKLIQKGLNNVLLGNVSSHEEVKKSFEAKFFNKCKL